MSEASKKELYCVLTGDVINSTRLKPEERLVLLDDLTGLLNTYKATSSNSLGIRADFEIYRGDSFQVLLNVPDQGLRMALLIRTFLRSQIAHTDQLIKSDARIAIGIGFANVLTKTVAASDGEPFQFSGRLLDTLKKQPNQIALKSRFTAFDREINVALVLLEGIISKWTTLQSEVVYYKLQGYTEVVIAEMLNVKQPAINQRAKAASWTAIERLLNRFEELPTP